MLFLISMVCMPGLRLSKYYSYFFKVNAMHFSQIYTIISYLTKTDGGRGITYYYQSWV
jgi:hypothetical protein